MAICYFSVDLGYKPPKKSSNTDFKLNKKELKQLFAFFSKLGFSTYCVLDLYDRIAHGLSASKSNCDVIIEKVIAII